ncbi:MAG: collagen-like protein [Bacteroidota bacterium]
MKKTVLLFLLSLTLIFSLHAQAPQGFNYQAIARNNAGVAIVNQNVGLQISLRQSTANGTIVYTETHSVTSNNIGLLNMVVGGGTVVTGIFTTIDWSAGPYFIEISTDLTGGTNYALMGTQQLMSVPYALYAANGNAGVQGVTGATGTAGANGSTGAIGVTGASGSVGLTGATGVAGVVGATGATGEIGITGATGAGVTGSTGPIGDRYATMSVTPMSISAPSTSISFMVETGLAYSIGQDVIIAFSSTEQMDGTITNYNSGTGAMDVTVSSSLGAGSGLQPWAVNLKGAPGPAGVVGATGNVGSTGVTGATGTIGVTGATGAVGVTGELGSTGATGNNGTNGIDGSTGATGTNGINGVNGNNGTNGATGSTGATGNNGTNGTNGAVGSTGATGAIATFAVQFNLVNSGSSAWLIDNAIDYNSGSNLNPSLKLYRGFTYKFNVTVGGHPFRISSSNVHPGVQYNVGVTNQDVQNGVLTFKVPHDAPATLYYLCVPHTGMIGTINIQ